MTTLLTLKKFKKISSEIFLKDFDFVNYFVGENGSGKTSILNAISYLKDGGNSRHFFGPESIVDFSIDNQTAKLFWNKDNPNKTEHIGDLPFVIYLMISNVEHEKGMNNLQVARINSTIGVGDAASLKSLNDFLLETGNSQLTAKKYVDQDDPFNQDNGRLIFENDLGSVDPTFIADGLRAKHNFSKTIKEWIMSINYIHSFNFIIIEEPENNLHPNFQKEIPEFLNSLYESINPAIAERTFFFISTHSPFIITAAAKYSSQKVYPLQNGRPVIIDFAKQTWNETNESTGYRGSECAYIVSKMLGAEISDIGYPENYAILEEYSLQIILDAARNNGLIKNVQFISASGVTKASDFTETIYEIEKLNTLIKCNPYYFDKYLLIIDNLQGIDDQKLKQRVAKIEHRLGSRLIELSKDSLEDYYQNIDIDIWTAAQKEIAESQEKNKGTIKAKYAHIISEKIIDVNLFSTLFNSELDFLLRKNYS